MFDETRFVRIVERYDGEERNIAEVNIVTII